jgi:DNA-binding transcriptional LysR family regulator
MPHLGEIMSGEPALRFDIQSLPTQTALREIETGGIDLAIVRTDSIAGEFQSAEMASLRYVLAVPRTLLRTREGAEVFEGRPLPFAELAGDGLFTRTVKTIAVKLGLNLRPILQAQTFSVLMSAVECGTTAAFVPDVAAKSLPEERFAIVSADGMQTLNRSLSLIWKSEVAESRAAVRRAISRLRRVFI